jgi:serine/threonine protein kinase
VETLDLVAGSGKGYFGPYRLVKALATSRTCRIIEAVRDGDEKRVVLKTLRKNFRDDKEQITQLKHEYNVGKGMKHPSVIRTLDFITEDDIPCVVLECFSTLSLRRAIREQFEETLYLVPRVVRQTAEGLLYFHQQGWLHRDVKPDNFLVDRKGNVKLIDFSIARKPKGTFSKLLGGKSKVQGTRSYMPPEQIRGEAVDQRSDIYSLGCSLFELVTGRLPYTATSSDQLLQKHLKTTVPAAKSVNDNVTKPFSDLVERMMAKKRQNRPNNLHDFLNEYKKIKVFHVQPRRAKQSSRSTEDSDPKPDDRR